MNTSKKLPYSVGLTGGIGSGKSAVAELFEKLGIKVIDADEVSRSLVKPKSATLETIAEHFGEQIILENGELDRRKLREIIFSDANKKQWLEDYLHPKIREIIFRELSLSSSTYAIVMVPLLLESQSYSFIDRILVVDCPEELQIKRVINRDQSKKDQVEKIIASQMPRKQRLKLADDIILNDGKISDLQQQILELNKIYERLNQEKNH